MDSAFSAYKIDVTRSIKRSKIRSTGVELYQSKSPACQTPHALRIDRKNGE